MANGNLSTVLAEHFEDDGRFPNSALPLLIYKGAGPADADGMEVLLRRNDWAPQWRGGVFDYHHYHSTAHEVLGVFSGWARLMMGGPQGRELLVEAGDIVVIPAGVAHQHVGSSDDFQLAGGYPPGQEWDILRGEPDDRPQADKNIAAVPMPRRDPVGGDSGPLLELWGEAD
ncbi:hypothetical protein GCM10007989_09560 [Devosia pacifica]|uniref:Cupin type-2 domain-containing protein n=1 Tax=Devosia pacifica TaxID=1335967 RepID=A0A918VP55_9HYPH|nr:cupin domain-containing protein [Devosia pacifica]GHA16596.1 hypothetical protein GCM10007989_09560 [Devosia pacifica]